MSPVPSGSAWNDRAGHSHAGVQVSPRGGTGQKHQTNSHRNADTDKISLGLTEYLRHSTYSKDSCKRADADFKKEYVKACRKA